MHFYQRLLCIGLLSIACSNVNAIQECDEEFNFLCRSDNICISLELKCDHNYDCADGSDEENCGKRFVFFCVSFEKNVRHHFGNVMIERNIYEYFNVTVENKIINSFTN